MIEVDSVSKRFGSVHALKDVSFRIDEGETVGLLGPNGAGKTTLLRVLSTYQSPTSGTVRIAGNDVQDEDLAVRRHLGYLPESVPLYEDQTPVEYLRYRGRLKRMSGAEIRDRIETVLSACGIDDLSSRPISALSKGYRQRLGLADALLAEPDVLLLDEPTEGLDPGQVRETREFIRSLGRDTTLLLSSHILADVRSVCDRILMIRGGSLKFDGPVDPSERSSGEHHIKLCVSGATDELDDAIRSISGVNEVECTSSTSSARTYEIRGSGDIREELFHVCSRYDAPIRELTPRRESLQELFTRFTEETAE
jgi:ABC-2 type transport system ATP-binding protein